MSRRGLRSDAQSHVSASDLKGSEPSIHHKSIGFSAHKTLGHCPTRFTSCSLVRVRASNILSLLHQLYFQSYPLRQHICKFIVCCKAYKQPFGMSSPLHSVWEAAVASPFAPVVSKDTQFLVGSSLLLFGEQPFRVEWQSSWLRLTETQALVLTGVFALSTNSLVQSSNHP